MLKTIRQNMSKPYRSIQDSKIKIILQTLSINTFIKMIGLIAP